MNTNNNVNVNVNARAFNKAVSVASCIANSRDASSNHLFNTVRATFGKTKVVLEANELLSSIRIILSAEDLGMETVQPGSILLTEIARSWLGRVDGFLSVMMNEENGNVILTADGDKFDLNKQSQDYQKDVFVELVNPDPSCKKITVPVSFLSDLCACAENAGNGKKNEQKLSLKAKDGSLVVASITEGHTKLTFFETEVDKSLNFETVVEPSSVEKVTKAITPFITSRKSESVDLYFGQKGMWIAADGICVHFHRLDLAFPDAKRVVSMRGWENVVSVSYKMLYRSVSNISSVSNGNCIWITFDDGFMEMKSTTVGDSSVESRIPLLLDTPDRKSVV